MKVIDILNKIANGEKVPRFIVKEKDYFEEEYRYVFEYYNSLRNATCGKWVETKIDGANYRKVNSAFLNEEVEVIEEKKIPEKINKNYKIRVFDPGKPHQTDYNMEELIEMLQDIFSKQDEIIDYLQGKGDSSNE